MDTVEERPSEGEERPSTPENDGEVEERGGRFTPGQQDPATVS